MEPKIYFLNEREIHLIGDAVAICWNVRFQKCEIIGDDGLVYTANRPMRETGTYGGPYIDFVSIRTDGEGELYVDDDSPVAGGLTADYAEKIAQELLEAAAYLRRVERE